MPDTAVDPAPRQSARTSAGASQEVPGSQEGSVRVDTTTYPAALSVLIPTFRRTPDLHRCLSALAMQERLPDQVVVTVRDIDAETREYLSGRLAADAGMRPPSVLPICIVMLQQEGVVAAMNAGVAAARGDIIALIDDDTAPHPDWLRRIAARFGAEDAADIGGVGGRDWQPVERGVAHPVGLVSWWGRVTGNHHLGAGAERPVDVLKGANSAYRAAPLRAAGFDPRLAGRGAQVHWELALGLAFRRAGWRLIYDPSIALDHFPAQRFDGDTTARGLFNARAQRDTAHNETLILLDAFDGIRRPASFCWSVLVGTRGTPGIAQCVRLQLARSSDSEPARLVATLKGRMAGLASYLRLRRQGVRYPASPLPRPGAPSGSPARERGSAESLTGQEQRA
jgi:GT2 family glycosyltransferase